MRRSHRNDRVDRIHRNEERGQSRQLPAIRAVCLGALLILVLMTTACSSKPPSPAAKDPLEGLSSSSGSPDVSESTAILPPDKPFRFTATPPGSAGPTPAPAAIQEPQPKDAAAAPAPAPSSTPRSSSAAAKKKPAIPVQRQQQELSTRKLSLAELRSKYSEFFKVNGQSNVKRIALTFDDGPDDRYTPQVLDVLKAHHVKATFFLLGKRAEQNPAIVQRIVQEGHVIGNHSYNHPLFTKLSLTDYKSQIERTRSILQAQIGYAPKLIRPPYGEISEEQLRWTGSNQYVIVNWNIDSLDWKGLSADQVTRNIMSHARPGAIVLQHSAGGDKEDLSGSVAALSTVIRKIKEDGYELVTVPQLLNLSKQLER